MVWEGIRKGLRRRERWGWGAKHPNPTFLVQQRNRRGDVASLVVLHSLPIGVPHWQPWCTLDRKITDAQAAPAKRRGCAYPQYGLEGRVWSPDSNICPSHARPASIPRGRRKCPASAGLHRPRRHLRPVERLHCSPVRRLRQIGPYGRARCSAQACSTNSGRQIRSTAVMANALAASIIPACPSGEAAAARNSRVWPRTVSGAIWT